MRDTRRILIGCALLAIAGLARAEPAPTPAGEFARNAAHWQPTEARTPALAPPAKRDPDVQPVSFQPREPALALAPPGKTKSFGEHGAGSLPGIFTMVFSLVLVLGLFYLMTWLFRRGMPKGAAQLPTDVLEVLGRTPIAQRQYVHLLRCGNKLLLVSATPAGMEALSEITDPVEVDRLLGLCRQAQPGSITGSFKQLLQQFGGEKSAPRSKTSTRSTNLLDEEVADA